MLATFGDIKKHLKIKDKLAVIENPVFKLHYRLTFMFFLVATILVSSRQYIGEHIRCIVDAGVPTHVVETYCFFTTTFTVVRYLNASLLDEYTPPHPGIGPFQDKDPIIVHAYYQWVPFVLFGQAILFYLPHFVWKRLEGGRVLSLVTGFENSALALGEISVQTRGGKVLSKVDFEKKVEKVRQVFLQRLHINRDWSVGLMFCEALNVANLIAQIFLMDSFLRGGFITLGTRILSANWEYGTDPLDIVFPKVTKCTFHKYGPTGSIQTHDALCIMALNIINEKIYTFLWFWTVVLVVATAGSVVWRVLSLVLHSRSRRFNKMVFKTAVDGNTLRTITERCDFADWLILSYIGKSMDGFVFKELMNQIAIELEETKPGAENGESETARLAK